MKTEKLWVFSVQDGIYGGVIKAKSKNEARKKLSKQCGTDMDSDIALIYELSNDKFDEFDICELWC